jgi:hypothetical protein
MHTHTGSHLYRQNDVLRFIDLFIFSCIDKITFVFLLLFLLRIQGGGGGGRGGKGSFRKGGGKGGKVYPSSCPNPNPNPLTLTVALTHNREVPKVESWAKVQGNSLTHSNIHIGV